MLEGRIKIETSQLSSRTSRKAPKPWLKSPKRYKAASPILRCGLLRLVTSWWPIKKYIRWLAHLAETKQLQKVALIWMHLCSFWLTLTFSLRSVFILYNQQLLNKSLRRWKINKQSFLRLHSKTSSFLSSKSSRTIVLRRSTFNLSPLSSCNKVTRKTIQLDLKRMPKPKFLKLMLRRCSCLTAQDSYLW